MSILSVSGDPEAPTKESAKFCLKQVLSNGSHENSQQILNVHMGKSKYFINFVTPIEGTENSILNMTSQPWSLDY